MTAALRQFDNRHTEEQESYLLDRIECLKRERERLEQRVRELERENSGLKAAGVTPHTDRCTIENCFYLRNGIEGKWNS